MDRIGRYKIVRELGRGAMGVVYHAIDPNIGRPVAIKTIRLGEGRKPEEQDRLRERLLREARSAGMLSHPGIVTIYDVEQQGDLAYIAMEYVDGPTLDHVLSQGPIAPEQMFSILGQTAVALDYAHQKGTVHRDIKPANIMIAGDGTAKITDFGIAKINASDQFTVTGTIVGTPHYMSPEQVQGLAVDGRSDQFSLGVIAYEMLTGEKPYTGEHLTTVVYKIVAEEPVSPHRLNPSLAGAIENVLRKSLAKKPEGRYRSCQELTEALEKACAASRGWKAMARGGSLNEPTMVEAARAAVKLPPARNPRQEAITTERAARKSGFVPFLVAILAATALLALIGWQAGPWLLQQGTPPPPVVTQRKVEPAVTPQQPAAAQKTEEKPSPMPPAEPLAAPAESKQPLLQAARRAPLPPVVTVQAVTVTSSPSGATATLDGNSEITCTTPCSLDAPPGRHRVAITLPGYQVEHREVDIGSSAVELPPVVLRAPGGTLMLTSVPAGASITVNGRKRPEVTPAQITLEPGTYNITVEKDGKQNTQMVDVRNGKLNYLKIVLGQ
jgi:tRNA A-37 threonylcarbamoyl transferase component Bud32